MGPCSPLGPRRTFRVAHCNSSCKPDCNGNCNMQHAALSTGPSMEGGRKPQATGFVSGLSAKVGPTRLGPPPQAYLSGPLNCIRERVSLERQPKVVLSDRGLLLFRESRVVLLESDEGLVCSCLSVPVCACALPLVAPAPAPVPATTYLLFLFEVGSHSFLPSSILSSSVQSDNLHPPILLPLTHYGLDFVRFYTVAFNIPSQLHLLSLVA